MQIFRMLRLSIGFIAFLLTPVSAEIYMRGSGSTLTIGQGAVLALDQPVYGFNGTLVQTSDNSILGQSVNFTQGTLTRNGQSSVVNGSLTSSATANLICLMGSQSFCGNGISVPSGFLVSSQDNRIDGTFSLGGPIILFDSQTTLTCALDRPLTQNILLNGGRLRLENDLAFADGCSVVGPGFVDVNGRRLSLGAQELLCSTPVVFENAYDITLANNLALMKQWVFKGDNFINGNGNWVALLDDSEIVIDHDSSLVLNNINIAHLSGSKIRCVDETGRLILVNAALNLLTNYTFTIGSLILQGDTVVRGDGFDVTFAYQSAKPLTLNLASSLWIDYGVTFSFDSEANNFVTSYCASQFILNGSRLHVTKNGLNLSKGTLVIGEDAELYIEDSCPDPESGALVNNGLTLGNGIMGQDCAVRFLPGASLEVLHGSIHYNNVQQASWRMPTVNSILQLDPGTLLQLEQSLNLHKGCLKMSSLAWLTQNNGSKLTGFVDCF